RPTSSTSRTSRTRGRAASSSSAVGPATQRITGATAVAAVIGDPVTHSLSPVIHNAAFAALGLDWVYVALPVPAGRAVEAVRALPALGLRGINVTMPHKADAAVACDELSPVAQRLGVANT